jgi:hypothetical protein
MLLVAAISMLSDIIKQVVSQPIERHALHEARRNDPVGIDI